MWRPQGEANYSERDVFGVTPRLELKKRLLRSNPALERAGSLYAAVCVLDEGLTPLGEDALPERTGHDAYKLFAECFGRDVPFGYARAGRTLVIVTRSIGDMAASEERRFRDDMVDKATRFATAAAAELDAPISLSVGPIFERLEDCEHAACDALIMADFSRFIELPVLVVDEGYYDGMKVMIEKQHPDFRLDNYERPIIAAVLNGNLTHAELIVNNFLTAHLTDPLMIFPTLPAVMVNTMRMCMSMLCPSPRALADSDPRYQKLQRAIRDSATVTAMRAHIHELFDMLDEYTRREGRDKAADDKLQGIVDYIDAHADDPLLGATMICDEFGVSASYFSRIFKERMGVNFSAYIQTLRITRAKTLILDTDMTIDAVAQQVGCQSGQNLFRLFKKLEGMSPSAYKSLVRGETPPAE